MHTYKANSRWCRSVWWTVFTSRCKQEWRFNFNQVSNTS